ncbi:hypothetical protein Syun_000913 [Stephania yunnanensis]|uniref:Uncharacterized protein n=1 Tax=Stephania yunnanensis TaxID=152371 RepID=A0AAP0Q6L8_9MAGN
MVTEDARQGKVHLALDGILHWKSKQFMAEHLRNGGVHLNEYAPAVTFSVLIYANALKWVVEAVKGVVNGSIESGSPKFWHEGPVTISIQKVNNNNRGTALKILRLSGGIKQQLLIPEGVRKDGEPWEQLSQRYNGGWLLGTHSKSAGGANNSQREPYGPRRRG